MRKRNGFNLYRRYREYIWRESKHNPLNSRLFPVIVTVLFCVIVWQMIEVRNRGLARELKTYEAWMEDPQNTSAYEESQKKSAILADLTCRTTQIETLTRRLAAWPKVDSGLLARLTEAGGKQIQITAGSYESTSGELLLRARSASPIDASNYVRKLKQLGLFQTVSYTGYAHEETWYTLRLKCILKADDDGKEEQNAAGVYDQ